VTVVVPLLYIVAFGLFILGLSGLTGPRTAVRGNKIAAAGMVVAVVATLLTVRHNWLLILVGLVIGGALGVPSARRVRMTAMPQMVALFNGVGGGAVALIAWSEFRTTDAFAGERCRSGAPWLRSASSRRSCPDARSGSAARSRR
jgi:H+-translocating NAD(P) transhydrogenase subunit beta